MGVTAKADCSRYQGEEARPAQGLSLMGRIYNRCVSTPTGAVRGFNIVIFVGVMLNSIAGIREECPASSESVPSELA